MDMEENTQLHDGAVPENVSEMNVTRRRFMRGAAAAGGLAAFGSPLSDVIPTHSGILSMNAYARETATMNEFEPNMVGPYGPWAASLAGDSPQTMSFRRSNIRKADLETWREAARQRVVDRLAIPDVNAASSVTVGKTYTYDGLHVEELTWRLPWGRPTEALLLKPENARGRLPGILAFHDHGGNKYFGARKITRTADRRHPLMEEHQSMYYSGRAWANEIAKRGYVVLVSDTFPFASRRVMMADVPVSIRQGLNDNDPENSDNIAAYNQWAGAHESIMAKSLFCAGTTWPGVFFAEDKAALDILCARNDVDAGNIGCGGLSGGGMRTVFAGGLDYRIKCAVCVGFMSTWRDFLLYKSFTHTWMTYVPLLPNEMDFPEILGLRVPLPTLVLNDADDDLYTLPEMRRADTILRTVYDKADAGDRYRGSFYPGEHKFDADMQKEAFDWLDYWLKG